jgi:hypothetical protein
METESRGPQDINPYAPPAPPADATSGADAKDFDLTRDEVRSFVGDRNSYYWGVWRRAKTRDDLMMGFNGAAFFFNLVWLLYRRMYREFWIGVGALVVATVGLAALGMATDRNVSGLETVCNVAIAATMGLFGNGLYLRHARRIIGAARAEQADPERRLQLLASRGGTSILWALIAAVCFLAVNLLSRR